MKLSAAEQESIIKLLARIYSDIAAIEQEFNLLAGDGDFRPRIEYFHDAVRAFTSADARHREARGRLSVELLAYDISCLRYIQSTPLCPFKPRGEPLSPATSMVMVKEGLLPKPHRPDRAMRERISELYQHYALLFAALLKPFADSDYHDRIEDLNQDIAELKAIAAQLKNITSKNIGDMTHLIQHLDEEQLRTMLFAFIQQQRFKKKDELSKMLNALKAYGAHKEKEIKVIEAAHLNYVLGQLAVFEGAKDTLKKMAVQGMNLVGKFVEASIAEARKDMGR